MFVKREGLIEKRRRAMRSFFGILLIGTVLMTLGSSTGLADQDYEEMINSHPLPRGVWEIVSSPMEIPKSMGATPGQTRGSPEILLSFVEGVSHSVLKLGAGVAEIATWLSRWFESFCIAI